ncbi:hypothetical protein BC826DRAFT_914911 [Russula brevipes]|nr:hypothetical protein BC826DRAFT_914911 [Russula brevipes]
MVSRHVLELCTSSTTLASELAKQPNQPVSRVAKHLSRHRGATLKQHTNVPLEDDGADELGTVAKCGAFPYRPSNLFLQVYRNVLHALDIHPLAGVVSPPLLGSSGVVPLSIVSVIPDIMRHYADLIVRAEAEILFATNYWEPSASSNIIADSLRKLSKRVEARGGEKVVMKLMYDRGNLKQVVKHRVLVDPAYWSRIGLPTEEEIPGVALEVINYHRPLLGTFHAKYLVADRRVACLNSNNVQDRPNVEMMVQLEGPIVDSIYDMALLCWSNIMNPPLPLLSKSPTYPDVYKFQKDNVDLKYIDPEAMSRATRAYLKEQHAINEAQDTQSDPQRCSSMDAVTAEKRRSDLIARHPSMRVPSLPKDEDTGLLDSETKVRRSEIPESHPNVTAPSRSDDATPNANGSARDRVSDESGESRTLDHDSGMTNNNDRSSTADAPILPDARAIDHQAAAQDDTWSDFRPHILHELHQPVPMAIVNRCPTGTPGHFPVRRFPQDIAWLSAMRYAQKSVLIQTPTFNASPIVSSTLDACRRGVQVTLYLDLGFNDQGEMIPFQGGTNEEVVHRMYTALNAEGNGAERHLDVFWYTGKDQTRPLNAAMKKRNCHGASPRRLVCPRGSCAARYLMLMEWNAFKFMAVDDQIAIVGSGNQDTQSWFHSQEVNVMVDSPELVGEWLRGIDANQNTRLYGRVSNKDGIWRNADGEVIQASGVAASSLFKRLKGLYNVMGRIGGTRGV